MISNPHVVGDGFNHLNEMKGERTATLESKKRGGRVMIVNRL